MDKLLEDFIADATQQRRALIEAIDVCIRSAVPSFNVERAGRFLGYGKFHYRYDSGREGDTYVVSMMNGSQTLSVYLMGGDGDKYLAEANAARLGKVSVGKSCIRIRRLENIKLDVLEELIRISADQHADSMI
jgi:hypothetical protein